MSNDESFASFGVKDYSTVNFSCANDLIGEWISSANQFSASHIKASSDATFQTLSSLGLCGNFPTKYDKTFDTLVLNVNSIANGAKGYVDELESQDIVMEEQFPMPEMEIDTGNSFRPIKTNYNSITGDDELEQDPSQILQADYVLPENTEQQLEFFDHISLEELINLVNILNSTANQRSVTIDQLLDDEEMEPMLKNILSNSPNLSDEYKKIINEGSSISLIKSLKSIINGEVKSVFGLDEQDTLLTVKEYLTNIAKENNIGLDELLNNQESKSILLNSMTNLENINTTLKNVTEENVQDVLSKIYDGENIAQSNYDENTQKIIRTQIDVKTSLENINYEDLLFKTEHSKELNSSVERLKKVGVFASALSNNSNITSILSNLIK